MTKIATTLPFVNTVNVRIIVYQCNKTVYQ